MKVLVLGGDGFCGWPTALHLSKAGHEVIIVDNLSRRKIDIELEIDSLTPISPMSTRIAAWEAITGKTIKFFNIDIANDYYTLRKLIQEEMIDTIVHFAEQRAAPYSMKDTPKKLYTVNNNINGTHNVLCSIVDSGRDIHLIHLGTMGVYGYGTSGIKIPEGYLQIQIPTENGKVTESEILYPANPGSVYHTTKTLDALLFAFYCRNDNIRITDLHQGIVWGTNTPETSQDQRLINRFDYDGDYGTVLNRFLMQAAIGHPLTIHGTGGQTRAFIHIRDTVKCIEIALNTPPLKGERVKIFNQMTETHKILDLANLVSQYTGAKIAFLDNPRKEADENELHVENKCFLDLGLEPTTLKEGLMMEVVEISQKYANRADCSKIRSKSYWTKEIEAKTINNKATSNNKLEAATVF